MTGRMILEGRRNKRMHVERNSSETPECCLLDLWQTPVLSIISSCSAEEGYNSSPASFLLLPHFSLGLGKVSNLLQMHDEFH